VTDAPRSGKPDELLAAFQDRWGRVASAARALVATGRI
jgi:hypothetical protein